MIAVSTIAVNLSHYPRRTELLGSLSYFMRGNLSIFLNEIFQQVFNNADIFILNLA